jgi:HEAT repeat protein
MFGVSIAMADRAAIAAESEGMSKKKKQTIIAGTTLALSALILYWQYGPTSEPDPEVLKNPEVKVVVEAEKKADTQQLAVLAKSSDYAVASRAVTSLANVGGPDAVRDYMNDQRSQMRYAAVTGLGATSDPARLPALQQFTKDPDPSVRTAAVTSIANIDDFRIFDELIPMLSDPNAQVRATAHQVIESRSGLVFSDYKSDGSASDRAKAIARIRQQVSKLKEVFDRNVAFEKQRRGRR